MFARWFYSNHLERLHPFIDNKNYSLSELTTFRAQVENELGIETALLNERVLLGRKLHYYERFNTFTNTNRPVRTIFTFNEKREIHTFSVQALPQEAATRYTNYVTKTELRLPFEGEWYVAAGGKTINLNQHAVAKDQRFAYDFIILNGRYSHSGDGSTNRDYYCYTKRILSPGKGRIIDMVSHMHENVPKQMGKTPGNYVIIDHGNGEYSFLAHLKKGSIIVQVGERVESGQFLGLCGNSGHSSEPHLHYHLQNTPIWYKGEGLPVQFMEYRSDNKIIVRGEPVLDDFVEHRK
ncbi:M23 family metallopeptidase [bacterium]